MRSLVAINAALSVLLGMGALSASVPGQRGVPTEARGSARNTAAPDKAAAPRPGDTADRRASWSPTTRSDSRGYLKRDGWTVAQDRRKARKARNVRRNRAAHK